MFKNWTNRDWVWLLGVLIGIIILLIASIFAKSLKIETNFSIISSAVSIALALVAIFIALSQSKDNQELSTSLNVMMSIMNEKISNVDEKVNKIDPDLLVRVYRHKIEEVIADVGETVKNNSEISAKELDEKLKDDLQELQLEFERIIKQQIPDKETIKKHYYQIGDKIKHKKFGIGNIKSVLASGELTEIEVEFTNPKFGTKRLLVEFAPIEKI
ncbi:hypothetical protein B1B04_08410 [Lysinibacillus sp. KCTC 33748]|uniref:motility associated factor glycosyltransferase family protein n=1 Tax=unclassified Lysinibacillus TaxID=2636778 RepID=UPI0009A88C99|nr:MULTISPECIES: motility associated factor glycosyltransferase family protein [unclassified Lysinibacillus]OXS74901.1 hypothetical protein B1B04_08410 [Lysinibacillus sp. KCTC 33748]SKB59582.1 hypothetical protein SAMN06295926_104165 [Lysinibacillus sp. AC-3]